MRFIIYKKQALTPYCRLLLWCAAVLLLGSERLDACSAIASGDRQRFLGANYDWRARGGMVFESPRGQVKASVSPSTDRQTMAWTSRLASLTVSQFGRDFPMQGMNEAGLSGLVLMSPSDYPPSGPLGVVTENLWLQYQLDQYETVADVVEHVSDLGIEKLSATLHWFFCDRSGACAAIDFIGGSAVIHTGHELSVRALTNSTYAVAQQRYEAWATEQRLLPQGYDSFARFIRLAAQSGQTGFGDRVSSIAAALDGVSLAGFTAWQTIFDLEKRQFRIRRHSLTPDKEPWQSFDVASGTRSCASPLRMMVLGEDRAWKPYDHQNVAAMFADAASGTTGLGAAARDRILQMSETVVCEPQGFL